MANISSSLVILLFLAQTGRLQESQACMSGFLDEDVLRSKAVLIGRTVSRQREQVIIPGISFTCAGTITEWIFVAERNTGGGRNRYPELQVWRLLQNSESTYNLVNSVAVSPQSTSQRNVYIHTLPGTIQYQPGDVLGIYYPPSDTSAYKILSVQHGGPDNYHTARQDRSSVRFDIQSPPVRVHRDYPLVGIQTDNPQCLTGFLSRDMLNARGQSLSGDARYRALSDQQRLIPSLTYGCQGKIGRIIVAAQNRGTGGGRGRYPEIHVMRLANPAYYLRTADFPLNELELPTIKSPNILEFTVSSSPYVRPGDVIRIFHPEASNSAYEVYHEPGVGPSNYFIDGLPSNTRTIFPIESVSMEDTSQPLIIVELVPKCSSLQNPVNGNVVFSDSVAVYGCDMGYRLEGVTQRLCDNETAEWVGTEPQCIFVDCGTPPTVTHGFTTLSRGTELGSVATYSCESQYVLAGSSTRECAEDSEWSGQSPVCKRQCNTLNNPPNGVVSVPNQPVEGDRASFYCSSNYELVGATTSVCQDTGQWSPEIPSCALIQCPELFSPGNGTVSYSLPDHRVGSTATFQCNVGYQLVGEARVQCQQDRQWSSQPPICQLIQCQSLHNPLNGVVRVSGREAMYTCNVGYHLEGVERQSCVNGEWSSQPPTCELIQCPMLYDPLNGRVVFNSTSVGSSALYTCNDGYLLIGRESVICELSTMQWSSASPLCALIDCGPPEEPSNGRVILPSDQTYLNGIANYTCATGYILQGNEHRVCQLNGLWSGSVPSCVAVDCGRAPDVSHADVITNGTRLYDVATYQCITGYQMTGTSQLVCRHQGQWIGARPSCSVVTCRRLSQPDNGNVYWGSTAFNSVASYTCHEGYVLIGMSQRTCQSSGYWSNRPPKCILIPTTSTVHQTQPYPTTTTINEMSQRTCQSSGYWSNRPPKCILIPTTSTVHQTQPYPTTTTINETISIQLYIPAINDRSSSVMTSYLRQSTSAYPLSVTTSHHVPATSDISRSTSSSVNVFIICGMIVLILCLILLVVVLIIMVYVKRRKLNELTAATTNSVENPLYSGHGSTPLTTLNNCFQLTTSDRKPSTLSGLELQHFGLPSMSESERDDHISISNGVHLYDLPSLSSTPRNPCILEQDEADTGSRRGHYYEFPDHYHLPTQYEIPVTPYEEPLSRARFHIYKNTLPTDVCIPTVDERRRSISIERQRRASCQTASSIVPSETDETGFFSEVATYWKPASDSAGLYEQLARNKYREISRKDIQVTELLGSGQFGHVNKGLWQTSGESLEVAIKTLKEGVKEEDKVRFLQEAAISGQFQHPNVVRLQGVVTVGEPIMIILELLPNGDLRDYLLKQRSVLGEIQDDTWPKQLLKFSRDIASGMTYLSSKAFVHRDLAARNILVAEDQTCKIGDFGMSRDLVEENYYISNGGKIPVKWTAPEALHYKKYSTASDVWSFGCLMYEIWSLGHKPFENNSNAEAMKMIDEGLRLPPPPGCPRAIYQLMIQCWHPRTASRPTFQVLLHALSWDSMRLLSWSEGDIGVHSQAPLLGAPLEAGLDLYVDLQRTYIVNTFTSS